MIGKLRLQLVDFIRGTTILQKLRELQQHQYTSPEEVAAIKASRLEALFQKAKQYTGYYKAFNTFEEVPILTKEIIRQNTPGLISTAYKKKLHKKQSGGSTGIPLVYYTTVESQSYLWAGILMSWESAGYRIGDRVAFIAGTSLIKTGIAHKLFYKLFNIDVYPATPLNEVTLAAHAAKIRQHKTAIIYGYANVINELANYAKTMPAGYFQHLKGVVCTAEILQDKVRANIEAALGVKVINQYGCNEGGSSAFECEHGSLHLLDSKIAYSMDAEGNLISTDLANDGFIMLKYFTGDMLEFSAHRCHCGRTSPVIKQVIGRTSDLVIDRFNNRLHDSFFYFLFKYEKSVRKYQASFDNSTLTINIETDGSQPAAYYQQFLAQVKQQVQFNQYDIRLNEPFVLTPNGKHKQIIDNREA